MKFSSFLVLNIYEIIICQGKILDRLKTVCYNVSKGKRGGTMAKDLNYSALLDYYGTLLTDKQSDALNLYYNEDLSLSEISEIMGISRQGVMDIIKRGEAQINQLEYGLKLSELYANISDAILSLEAIILNIQDEEIRLKLKDILNKLQ